MPISGLRDQTHSCSVTERIDDERECWRGLAAARVVQVIAWTKRTPIRENAHEAALSDIRFHQVFREVRKSKAFQRAVPHHGHGVEHEPALGHGL